MSRRKGLKRQLLDDVSVVETELWGAGDPALFDAGRDYDTALRRVLAYAVRALGHEDLKAACKRLGYVKAANALDEAHEIQRVWDDEEG